MELPVSSKTVRVQAIDTTTRMSCDANAFVQPQIKNHERLNFKTLCFLLEHDGEFILFDCGSRKDFWNSSPQTSKMIGSHVPGLEIKSGVDEILVNQGFDLDNLSMISFPSFPYVFVLMLDRGHCLESLALGPCRRRFQVPSVNGYCCWAWLHSKLCAWVAREPRESCASKRPKVSQLTGTADQNC